MRPCPHKVTVAQDRSLSNGNKEKRIRIRIRLRGGILWLLRDWSLVVAFGRFHEAMDEEIVDKGQADQNAADPEADLFDIAG
jgi:hypothetical protein